MSYLFEDLYITKQGDKYIGELGKYPLVYLTLKKAKQDNWEETYEKLSYTERGTGSYVTQDINAIENLKQTLIRDEVNRFHMRMSQFGLTNDQILQYIKIYTEGSE